MYRLVGSLATAVGPGPRGLPALPLGGLCLFIFVVFMCPHDLIVSFEFKSKWFELPAPSFVDGSGGSFEHFAAAFVATNKGSR